jgi:MoxR-like ATPase
MTFPYYTGNPHKRHADRPAELPGSRRARQIDPAHYKADPGLVDAVNVALLLNQPLLLTGEPGTGKTQLAYSIAWELGFEPPLMFETKSTSMARDLFYTYDTLGRFHAAQTGEGSQRSLDYITYNALGIAILRSHEEADVHAYLPPDFTHGGRRRSVVLIDEVDKAPRDFPNDLLNEVEGMYFRVPELGNVRLAAGEELRPVLIITSNSEKHLPDAFLRRCIYYNIPFPDVTQADGRQRLTEIVLARSTQFADDHSPLLAEALDFFAKLREPNSGLRKKPATAELLNWLGALHGAGAPAAEPLRQHAELAAASLGALVKSASDQEVARTLLAEWLQHPPA